MIAALLTIGAVLLLVGLLLGWGEPPDRPSKRHRRKK